MSVMREFFFMGGYAFYVWTSFGLALILIGGVALYAFGELARVRRETFRASLARVRREPDATDTPAGGSA